MTVKTFVKGEATKYLKEDSKLIPIILKDGWEEKKPEPKKTSKKKED